MLGFHPIAAVPIAALLAQGGGGEEPAPPVVTVASNSLGGGGGFGAAPERQPVVVKRRIQKTHIIRVGEWPEGEFPDPIAIEIDPLDMSEILRAQPRRDRASSHHDGDDEEALIALLAFSA